MVGWIEEEHRQVVNERSLIGFDDEAEVGLALVDQVVGKLARAEKRIGSGVSVFEIQVVEERDGRADLVGLF